MIATPVPSGYSRVRLEGRELVARGDALGALGAVLAAAPSLHEWAAAQPGARALTGRMTAYAVGLPGTALRAVVRHSQHGGVLASMTGDLFPPPTRSARELRLSLALRDRGVRTPAVLGYATYPGPMGLRRADVVVQEVEHARDLADVLVHGDDAQRREAMLATADLLDTLAVAGVRHPDLNIKNVLVEQLPDGGAVAHLLDIDRVRLATAHDPAVARANLSRLVRSARKWRELFGARITDEELGALAAPLA
jgi:hypothetical protein